MKLDFVNTDALGRKGRSFLSDRDKRLLRVKLEKNKSIEALVDQGSIPTDFDEKKILQEYWNKTRSSKDEFLEFYSNRKRRRMLFLVFNSNYEQEKIGIHDLDNFLTLFANDYTESTLHRFIYLLLDGWDYLTNDKGSFTKLTGFISTRFEQTNALQKRTKLVITNKELILSDNGPQLFAKKILENNSSHKEICNRVGLRFNSSVYHSYVIEALFLFQLQAKKYGQVKKYIQLIVNDPSIFSVRSKKKMIAALILHVDSKTNMSEMKEIVKKAAFNKDIIGDPSIKSRWTVWQGGKPLDQQTLETARKILNTWILSSFIDIFFNRLISDPDRKKYWLSKIKYISSVRVYGSIDAKRVLLSDKRVMQFVNTDRFRQVGFSGTNAGIVMEIGNYHIVEFTDAGALYCYKKSEDVLSFRVEKVADLKRTHLPLACTVTPQEYYDDIGYLNRNRYYLIKQGRIIHRSGRGIKQAVIWMDTVDLWLEKFVK